MKKNQVDYQTYLKISADCAAAEREESGGMKRKSWIRHSRHVKKR